MLGHLGEGHCDNCNVVREQEDGHCHYYTLIMQHGKVKATSSVSHMRQQGEGHLECFSDVRQPAVVLRDVKVTGSIFVKVTGEAVVW